MSNVLMLPGKYKFPPLIVCLYLLLSTFESVGISMGFTQRIWGLAFFIDYLCQFAILVAFFKIMMGTFNTVNKRIFKIALIALIINLLTGMSVFANDGSLTDALRATQVWGVGGVVIALAYWNDRQARTLFVCLVTIQLIISILIVIYPDGILKSIRMDQYTIQADAPLIYDAEQHVIASRPSAQFENSLKMALYAGLGIVIGIHTIAAGRRKRILLFGVFLSLLGIICSLISAGRFVWIALILSILLLVLRDMKKYLFPAIICVLVAGLGYKIISFVIDYSEFLPSGMIVHDETLRINAFEGSISAITTHPFFGHGSVNAILQNGFYFPHQSPLAHAALYGIASGCGMFYLLIIAAFAIYYYKMSRVCQYDKANMHGIVGLSSSINENYLMSTVALLVIVLSFTNHSAGNMLQYLCLGFACVPYCLGGMPVPANFNSSSQCSIQSNNIPYDLAI